MSCCSLRIYGVFLLLSQEKNRPEFRKREASSNGKVPALLSKSRIQPERIDPRSDVQLVEELILSIFSERNLFSLMFWLDKIYFLIELKHCFLNSCRTSIIFWLSTVNWWLDSIFTKRRLAPIDRAKHYSRFTLLTASYFKAKQTYKGGLKISYPQAN